MREITHGSLFTGIGGIDLGFEWAGIETKWQVEIDDYCQKLLSIRFPHTKKFTDVRKVGSHNLEKVDIISGGFPCPAFSQAGKRGGFEQDDLFYEMIRVCDERKPKAIVFENVEGFKKWTKTLRQEIENIGYEWGDAIFDARDFGIPQARRRYFAVCIQRGVLFGSQYLRRIQRKKDSSIYGLQPNNKNTERRWTPTVKTKEEWRTIFADSRRIRKNNGISSRLDRHRKFGLGNAVVPHIPYIIGKRLKELCQENQAEKH